MLTKACQLTVVEALTEDMTDNWCDQTLRKLWERRKLFGVANVLLALFQYTSRIYYPLSAFR